MSKKNILFFLFFLFCLSFIFPSTAHAHMTHEVEMIEGDIIELKHYSDYTSFDYQWEIVEGDDVVSIVSWSSSDPAVRIKAYKPGSAEVVGYATRGSGSREATYEDHFKIEVKEASFMLYFSVIGGSCSVSSKKIMIGAPCGKLPTPKRSGYKFLGWYTKPDGGSKVTAATIFRGSDDRTVYAHWSKKASADSSSGPNGTSESTPVRKISCSKNIKTNVKALRKCLKAHRLKKSVLPVHFYGSDVKSVPGIRSEKSKWEDGHLTCYYVLYDNDKFVFMKRMYWTSGSELLYVVSTNKTITGKAQVHVYRGKKSDGIILYSEDKYLAKKISISKYKTGSSKYLDMTMKGCNALLKKQTNLRLKDIGFKSFK